jgi:predicted metal-dependent hydrolase
MSTTHGNLKVPRDPFLEGLALFNAAHFFEAHEVLEDVWRAAPEPERKFFQGLIQVAVALHHYSKGNRIGCRSLLERARRNLTPYPADHRGVDLDSLRCQVDEWRSAIDHGNPVPALPMIRFEPFPK